MRSIILASIILLAWQFGLVFVPKSAPPAQTAPAAAPIDLASLHAQAKEAMERLLQAQDQRMKLANNLMP